MDKNESNIFIGIKQWIRGVLGWELWKLAVWLRFPKGTDPEKDIELTKEASKDE